MTDTAAQATPLAPLPEGMEVERALELDAIIQRAHDAAEAFRKLDQEQVDAIVWAMVVAGLENTTTLAEAAIEETGFGVLEDKVVKNFVATEFLYDYLKDKKTVGVVGEDPEAGIQYVAEPIGTVLAITPVTNPTSTVLFKAIVAAKTRNSIIFRPSPRAWKCGLKAVEILREAGEAAGMPPGALQLIPDLPHNVTHYMFKHPGIDFIWTTGGPKVVAAANSAGKPAVSVGPGNAPVYLHRSTDIKMAVVDILISKTFDASVICPAEQTAVADDPIYDDLVAEFERMGAKVLTPEETDKLARFAFLEDGSVNLNALGQTAPVLAKRAGIEADEATKILVAPLPTDLDELRAHPLVHEKLMPVLGLVRSPNPEHGIAACVLVTESGGLGHTSAVYATDPAVIEAYAMAVRTGRILVNAPTAVGALGGVYNSLRPTFSLGCGTWGGSSTTDNVNYTNLLNIKTVSRRHTPPQWFRVPSETYFNMGAVSALDEMRVSKAVIVTDQMLADRGVAEEVQAHLDGAHVEVFSGIVPEPDEELIRAGVELIKRVEPELIVAVGGGSVIDATKAMRLFYENPSLTVRGLTLPFLDARKRVADYPPQKHKVRLVAIPTTSGTGSEVSPASVIRVGTRKATLVDYGLVPDVAIVDPHFTMSMPPSVTADTGIDALTHALEAGVSIFASSYTDALCAQACRLIFEYLPRAVADGNDVEARTAMANAACMAGIAFSNAFVGINHALAHSVGPRFGVPHGRANAIFIPHTMRYNASLPSKFMPAPGYSSYVAPDKYAELGWILFGGHTPEERRERLFTRVDELLAEVGMPRTLKEAGVPEDEFNAAVPDLARAAFDDASLRTNPRMPMVMEILQLLGKAYYG